MRSIVPGSNSEYTSNTPSVILHRVRRNKTSSGGNTDPQKIDSRMSTEASISIAATPTAVKVIRGSLTSTNRSSQSLPPKRTGLTSSTSKAISLSNTKQRPLMQASLRTQSTMSMPVVVPRDNQDLESFRVVNATSETISHALRLNRPSHKHKPSSAASDNKVQLVEKASVSMSERSDLDVNSSLSSGGPRSQVASESDKREPDNTRDIAEDFERVISLEQPLQSQIDNGMFISPG